MADEQERIAETVEDIQGLRSKLSDRHSDNINLSLRLDSALKAVVGSLGATLGIPETTRFVPTPIEKMNGIIVSGNFDKQQVADQKEIETFVENTKAAYESFLGNTGYDIIAGTDQETIRGVAKLAGLDDYKTATVDVAYITTIKEAIQEKNKTATDRAAVLNSIAVEDVPVVSTEEVPSADEPVVDEVESEEDTKLTIAEQSEIKRLATEEYTKLFGAEPAKSLSGPKILDLIEAKNAEAK